jgi:microcystin-dependent protein
VAFNGSGTFNRIYNWVTDKSNVVPVTASRMDAEMDGMATGLTTAICRDGQSTTTARIPFAAGIGMSDGSVGTPAINFTGDANSGIYVIGPDNIGVSVAGAKVLDIATTGLTITGRVTSSGDCIADDILSTTGDVNAAVIKQGTYRLVPAGAIMPYAGAAAPDGWLLCYGQAVDRTTYADLFTAISTTYGVGDGSTTFNLPDLRGRVVAGQDDMGGSSANRLTGLTNGIDGDTLGATGGEEAHTLTQAQLPNVTLTTTIAAGQGSHTHALNNGGVVLTGTSAAGSAVEGSFYAGTSIANATLPEMGGTTPTGGSGTALNVIQPTLILNYIIKT